MSEKERLFNSRSKIKLLPKHTGAISHGNEPLSHWVCADKNFYLVASDVFLE